jgi:pimeloyl-ACP methyl ester carboxylesterase
MDRQVKIGFWLIMRGIVGALLLVPLLLPGAKATRQTLQAETLILDSNLNPVSTITDGDQIHLQVILSDDTQQPLSVRFSLDGLELADVGCTVQSGDDRCQTESFFSLGWYWSGEKMPVQPHAVQAVSSGASLGAPAAVTVAPRPVVMVHGFSSSWDAWENYLGSDGYLAGVGLSGYAVGDGQVPGIMNTGNLADPAQRTNTIAENAAILGEYIQAVKLNTGAQRVDLIAHSMGGLISRYYIDRVMAERDIAQLIMLGSPMSGTPCANLPAALGLYLPATLEIRPAYVSAIFNPLIAHRHGVPFHALAGVPILEAFKSPCTTVPSDLAVSLESVTAIPLDSAQMKILHTELNSSPQVFDGYVKPLLQASPGKFPEEPDPVAPGSTGDALQFSRLFSGHILPGGTREVTIQIESGVSVASFALYDTSRSLDVSVRGASGNEIELSAEKNGLVVVEDPSSLLYLGYGFPDPKPGAWRVNILTTDATPAQGADYALAAHFTGGAELRPHLSVLLPQVGENVNIGAGLYLNGSQVELQSAQAQVRAPDGQVSSLIMPIDNEQAQLDWKPALPGLYGIDLHVEGRTSDDVVLERTAFLSLQAQPGADTLKRTLVILGASLLIASLFITIGVWFWIRFRRSREFRES